jgi:hypothetical protein
MAIPLPSDAVAEVIAIGNRTAAAYPRAWSKCHHEGDPERLDFIVLFARAAYHSAVINRTHRAGINGKRGDEDDPSMDILDFLANGTTNLRDVTAADVVLGAGGSNPKIHYQDLTDPNGAGAVWIDPFSWPTHYPYDEPQPSTGLLAYSLFWGLGGEKHDPARFDEQLRQYKDHGADAVRIIAHLPRDWTFRHIGLEWSDPDFVDMLKRADDRLDRHDLKWYLTFTAGVVGIETESSQDALVDRINQAFAGRPDRRLVDEMANEYATNGLTTTIIRRMCRRNAQYSQRAKWVSLSSPNSIHDGSGASTPDEVQRMYGGLPEANAITPHWNRSTNAPPDLGPYAPAIVICGEPRGPMSSGSETSDPAELVADYKLAVQAGYVLYVGHSDSGFISTFLYPSATADHGNWRLYSDHTNGPACLEGLRDYRLTGAEPGHGGGGGGGGGDVPRPDRGDYMRACDETHQFYMAPEGLQRPEGLWIDGHPDFEGLAAWPYDVYCGEREKGRPHEDAMDTVRSHIRHSDEWRRKHPGETPW